jgi:hypothetical protein
MKFGLGWHKRPRKGLYFQLLIGVKLALLILMYGCQEGQWILCSHRKNLIFGNNGNIWECHAFACQWGVCKTWVKCLGQKWGKVSLESQPWPSFWHFLFYVKSSIFNKDLVCFKGHSIPRDFGVQANHCPLRRKTSLQGVFTLTTNFWIFWVINDTCDQKFL